MGYIMADLYSAIASALTYYTENGVSWICLPSQVKLWMMDVFVEQMIFFLLLLAKCLFWSAVNSSLVVLIPLIELDHPAQMSNLMVDQTQSLNAFLCKFFSIFLLQLRMSISFQYYKSYSYNQKLKVVKYARLNSEAETSKCYKINVVRSIFFYPSFHFHMNSHA